MPSTSSTATRPIRLCDGLPLGGGKAGARWLVLCDTNGGTLPHEIERIVGESSQEDPGRSPRHPQHNDTENAVANTWPPWRPACARCRARSTVG